MTTPTYEAEQRTIRSWMDEAENRDRDIADYVLLMRAIASRAMAWAALADDRGASLGPPALTNPGHEEAFENIEEAFRMADRKLSTFLDQPASTHRRSSIRQVCRIATEATTEYTNVMQRIATEASERAEFAEGADR